MPIKGYAGHQINYRRVLNNVHQITLNKLEEKVSDGLQASRLACSGSLWLSYRLQHAREQGRLMHPLYVA